MADKILIHSNPSQDQSYLTYNVDKNPNIFLSYIARDKSEDNQIHQQVHEPLAQEIISFFDPTPVAISNSKIEVQSNLNKKGLYEKIEDNSNIISIISDSNTNTITLTVDNLDYQAGDIVFIQGVDIIPEINYKIISTPQQGQIVINCKESLLVKTTPPKIYKVEYRWDEKYTTPLGLYTIGKLVTDKDNPIEGNIINEEIYLNGIWQSISNYFYSTNDQNLTSVFLNIKDPNIRVNTGDYILFQIIKDNNISLTESESLIDGINSEVNNLGIESFLYQVLAFNDQELILDKPFPFTTDIIEKQEFKFKITLLNRGKNTISKNLYENTWEFHEIHRKNLLGDDILKNYLSYGGVEYLGLTTQINDFLKDTKTPIILLHFNDKIKDKISTIKNELELHFPNLLLQGEESGTIFTNGESFYDNKSVGTYSPLILKYPKNNFKTLGYVFNDLRIIVITDEEIVTALSYNSNRNYTLPGSSKEEYEFIINKNNRNKNFNKFNALSIVEIEKGTGNYENMVQVTFDKDHNFIDGDQIVIDKITSIISSVNLNSIFNVKRLDDKNIILLLPASDNVALIVNNTIDFSSYKGEGICYQKKLDYSYFMTYRIRGKFYNTLPMATLLPFNFQNNSKVDNVNGSLSITIPKLTHLTDKDLLTGFNVTTDNINGIDSPHFDIIIGTYTFDPENISVITGVENLKIIPGESFYDNNGYQNNSHSKIIQADTYLNKYITTDLLTKTDASQGEILFNEFNESNASYCTFYKPIPQDIDISSNWIEMKQGDRTKGGWYINNCGIYNIQNKEQLYKNVTSLLTGNNIWLLGNIKFKESIDQYRLTIKAKIPANKWNGTTNPTFNPLDSTNSAKLISEIAFVPKQLSEDGTEIIYDETPYIYAKINPPIKKTSTSDISLSLSIDF